MSIEGQGHFFTIYFPGFVCFVLYLAKISGERLQDHWSSGFFLWERCETDEIFGETTKNKMRLNDVPVTTILGGKPVFDW